MEAEGLDVMDKKLKNPMEREESDQMLKKLKRGTESETMNNQGGNNDDENVYFYGYDSSSSEDHYVSDDGGDDDCCCAYYVEGPGPEPGEEYEWRPSKKVYDLVEWEGLRTPEIRVILEDSEISIPIDQNIPLPQELYNARRRGRIIADKSKEEFDSTIKSYTKVQLRMVYEELPQHVVFEVARLALASFKEQQDGDYEYVRYVKTRPAFSQQFGIHMIFIAHPRGDNSVGKLFSVHLATGDPPKVLDCRILSTIDAQSVYTGKPLCMGKKVPLKRKDIACRYCAQEFN